MNQMFLVVAYDITSNRRRTRVAHFLKDYGYRVNYSVFECRIPRSRYPELRAGLNQRIHPKKDRVLLYELCVTCQGKQDVLGDIFLPHDPAVIAV